VRCALREALPQARVHVFPDYGHNPFWDDPAAVAAQINPFLLQ
jgi:pimeloyl-ACP methyl ester carboxylesterase